MSSPSRSRAPERTTSPVGSGPGPSVLVTTRGLLAAATAVGSLAAGLALGSPGLVALAAAIGAVLAAGIVTVLVHRRPSSSSCRVVVPAGIVYVHDDATVSVTVGGAGGRTLERVRVEAEIGSDGGGVEAGWREIGRLGVARLSRLHPVGPLAGGASGVAIRVPTARRGILGLAPPRLWRADALGLVARAAGAGPGAAVVVCPRPVPVAGGPVAARAGTTRHTFGDAGSDGDRVGVRPYVPGERGSLVHWPTSARRGRLMVREDEDAGPRWLGILCDVRAPVSEAGALEDVVSLAAGVGLDAIGAGWGVVVGLVDDHGARTVAAVTGPAALLARLAALEPAERRTGTGTGTGALGDAMRGAAGRIAPVEPREPVEAIDADEAVVVTVGTDARSATVVIAADVRTGERILR